MRRNSRKPKQLQLLLPESSDIQKLIEDNRQLKIENERLRVQNASLSQELARFQQLVTADSTTPYPEKSPDGHPPKGAVMTHSPVPSRVTKKSTVQEKIALFRSYFRGRDDVYAVRGQERDGKAPYYPKRQNIRIKSGEVTFGDAIPLTDDAIRFLFFQA